MKNKTEKNTSQKGGWGESVACNFLINNGYRIIKQNYRKKWGEIDIISKRKDSTLVFVEVKTLYKNAANFAGLVPEDNLTSRKLKNLKRTCELFANNNPDLINERRGWQIDLIGVAILTNNKNNCIIKHYPNIS